MSNFDKLERKLDRLEVTNHIALVVVVAVVLLGNAIWIVL